jgi:hypothetical protein
MTASSVGYESAGTIRGEDPLKCFETSIVDTLDTVPSI